MSQDEDTNSHYTVDNWIIIVLNINSEVRGFKDYLKGILRIDTRAEYFNEWNEFYSAVCDKHLSQPDITYDHTTHLLFGNISTLEDYVNEALKLVPPIQKYAKVAKVANQRGSICMQFQVGEGRYASDQIQMHTELCQNVIAAMPQSPGTSSKLSDTSNAIDSAIKQQVHEWEEKLNAATSNLEYQFKPRLETMEHDIPITIARAVKDSFQQMMEQSNKEVDNLNTKVETARQQSKEIQNTIDDSILQVQRVQDKLTGELKNATAKFDKIQNQTRVLTTKTTESYERLIKEYLTAKADLQTEIMTAGTYFDTNEAKLEKEVKLCLETMEKHKDQNEYPSKSVKHKHYADKYTINGEIVQVCSKKFQEDHTEIECDSKDTLFIMYEILRHIGEQYRVQVTAIKDIKPWDIDTQSFPPTFPYTKMNFDDKEVCLKAYNSMSLALANKLKAGVKFSTSYVAAKMAINTYTTQGYVMLYDLIKTIHPKLLSNKAVRSKKPGFRGDLNKYITQYCNYLKYQLNCDKPHHYKDDEISDNVIHALKSSEWNSKLQTGINV